MAESTQNGTLTAAKVNAMTFDEWLQYGIDNKFCTQQVCETHAGVELTDTESELMENGTDVCLHVVRLGSPEQWEAEAQDMKAFIDE